MGDLLVSNVPNVLMALHVELVQLCSACVSTGINAPQTLSDTLHLATSGLSATWSIDERTSEISSFCAKLAQDVRQSKKAERLIPSHAKVVGQFWGVIANLMVCTAPLASVESSYADATDCLRKLMAHQDRLQSAVDVMTADGQSLEGVWKAALNDHMRD